MDDEIKLNVGSGGTEIPGYIGIDHKQGGEAYPLTYNNGELVADKSVSVLLASHVLEHFSHRDVATVVAEWVRVLKPGGWLKIAVPDLEWIAKNYLSGKKINVQGYLMGGQSDGDDFHRCAFDREELLNLLQFSGLVDIQPWASDVKDCAALPVSLNLMGRKPPILPKMKIAGVMSAPRLLFSDNITCWAKALLPFGICQYVTGGAFWGQCLERAMVEAVKDFDWIMTVDYDSVFDRENVAKLLRLAAENPHADAIAPLQMKRGRTGSKPLFVIRDHVGQVVTEIDAATFNQPLVKVQTAHFGLTMIRVSALKDLPHPWFLGVPNKDGQWEEGRVDDDIYFWHQWEKAGKSLYVAPRVVIGHWEGVVSWPDKDFNVIHQYPTEFHENGMPENVWE